MRMPVRVTVLPASARSRDCKRYVVAVSMIMAAVRVAVMVMPGREHADEVDEQADEADEQKLAGRHVRRIDQALDRLEDDEDRDKDQKHAVGEAGQRLDAAVAGRSVAIEMSRNAPVRERAIGLPGRHDRCVQAHRQRQAVEEHVDR